MSKLNNGKANRALGFESLEAREYLSAEGLAPPITQIQIGPVPLTAQNVNAIRDIVLDASLIVIPPASPQLQALETDDLLQDLSHDFFAGNDFTRQEIRTGMSEPLPRANPQARPNDLIITFSFSSAPASNIRPGYPSGPVISIDGVSMSREPESRSEYHSPPLGSRFNQEIIASYGANFISNSNASSKAEITNVSLSNSSFKPSTNTQQQSNLDFDIDFTSNRDSKPANNASDSNALKLDLQQYEAKNKALHLLDQSINRLSDDANSMNGQTDKSEFKPQTSSRSHGNIRSSEADLRNDDGLIALSMHYDILPTVPADNATQPTSTMAWTQRVAIGQSMHALRPSPKSQAQFAISAQAEDEATQEPQQSSQYWAILPVAASMFAIDWFRRNLHFRKNKPQDETFVSKVQLH